MQTVAEFLAGQLVAAGVKIVFGLPGGENVEVLDAIRQQRIDFVLVKNESSACFMADVTARLTGKPSVALTTLGPGATNATVGLAHCYLDRAPVLLITAQTDTHLIGTHTHQYIDLQSVFRPITKLTADIQPETAVSTIQHGLSLLQSGRPGPVHLGINNRVAAQSIVAPDAAPTRYIAAQPDYESVQAITQVLSDKQRPVIVVGLGLEPDRPYPQLQSLAEKLNAPVIDTPKSRGALSTEHPLFVGTIGLTRTDPAYQLLDESDCILAVGFDVVELVKPWGQSQPVIWIADWENQDPRIPAEAEFVGDIRAMLNELTRIERVATSSNWGARRVEQFRASTQSDNLPIPQSGRLLPQDVLASIRANTPDDIIITTDVGSHKIFTALNWQAYAPNRYFVSNGLSAMGFGLVAAAAAARETGQHTICITGDAGMAMVIGELALAAEMNLPVIVVVMNDDALDLIRSAQRRRDKPVFGTEFANPDYRRIAQAYDIDFHRVHHYTQCDDAIRAALEHKKPTLIEAFIDPVGYPTTVK